MFKRVMIRYVSLLLMLGCFISCTSKFCTDSFQKGHFSGSRYFDYYNWFSVDVPGQDKSMIQELHTETLSMVVFHRIFGGLVRYEVCQYPDENFKELREMENILGGRGEFLQQLFFTCGYLKIQSEFPGTTILHEEIVDLENEGKAYYAILKIPNGNSCINRDTGKSLDSIRGYLVFLSNQQLVAMSIQKPPFFEMCLHRLYNPNTGLPPILLYDLMEEKKQYRNEYNLE